MMDLSRETIKKLRGLIVFTILILVGLWNLSVVLEAVGFIWGILFPFVLGGAIAFVINVHMSFIEKTLFGEKENRGRWKRKLARPLSLVITIVLAVTVIVLVMFGVIPQLGNTVVSLGNSIADFLPRMRDWIAEFTNNNPDIMDYVNQLSFNPDQMVNWAMSFLGS